MTRQLPIVVEGEENQLVALVSGNGERLAVWQNSRYRWLERNGVLQSAFDRRAPHRPLLPHHHELLCAAQAGGMQIRRVLELGLGGGANLRYLQHHHPLERYTLIELSHQVIDLFRQHFAPPGDYQLLVGDAEDLLPQQACDYDLVVIDIATELGFPPLLRQGEFWHQALSRLRPGGRLIANLLPANDPQLSQLTALIRRTLSVPLRLTEVRGYANVILSATRALSCELD